MKDLSAGETVGGLSAPTLERQAVTAAAEAIEASLRQYPITRSAFDARLGWGASVEEIATVALAAAVPHLERRIRESIAGEEREAAWDARQQAIGECIVDLSSALGSDSTSWQQLLELARLHREIVGNARIARGSSS